MRVCVLGPLEVVDDGGAVLLGGPKERRLLAALALQPGQVVAESRLVDVLWGDYPPRTATKTLQNYVLRLRKALSSGSGGLSIVTVPPGYALRGAPEAFDSLDAAGRIARAREAASAGDHRRAAELLEGALGCWRGPSLVEFAGEPFALAEAARLDELRQAALDERIDAELAVGRHGACVAELEALLAENPLRERRWGQLMVALYRSSRQADALRAYQAARSRLGDELGIEPSPSLRRLESDVLAQAASLDYRPAIAAEAAVGDGAGAGAAPWTGDEPEPAAVAAPDRPLVGRAAELARLDAELAAASAGQGRAVLISGEAGIGKSRLAEAVAHSARAGGQVTGWGGSVEGGGTPAYWPGWRWSAACSTPPPPRRWPRRSAGEPPSWPRSCPRSRSTPARSRPRPPLTQRRRACGCSRRWPASWSVSAATIPGGGPRRPAVGRRGVPAAPGPPRHPAAPVAPPRGRHLPGGRGRARPPPHRRPGRPGPPWRGRAHRLEGAHQP